MNQSTIKPLIVCGPSSVGKGTLLKKIKELFPNTFGDSVSHTTRKPREGEENGVQYHFISKEMFKNKRKNDEFVENIKYCENYYGTSIEAIKKVQQNNLICILEIAIQSAEYIKNNVTNIDANYLFVTCKGKINTLKERMTNRKSETEETMKKRLDAAVKEFKFVEENHDFFDCIISNDNLELSTQQLVNQLKEWYPSIQTPKYYLSSPKIGNVSHSDVEIGIHINLDDENKHKLYNKTGMYGSLGTNAVCCILGVGALYMLVKKYV